MFLFYRREYARLITLIHDQYKEEKKAIEKLEQKISSLASLAATGDPVEKKAQEDLKKKKMMETFWITKLQKNA